MIRITVDMDGVVADFDGHVAELYWQWYGVDLREKREGSVTDHLIRELTHFPSNTQFWKWINQIPNFWVTMPPIPGALGALRELKNDPNVDMRIVTSRAGVKAGAETRAWFAHHAGWNMSLHTFSPKDEVRLTNADIMNGMRGVDKYKISTDVHIDDNAHVLAPFCKNTAARTILFKQPWSYSRLEGEADFDSILDFEPQKNWEIIKRGIF